MGSYRQWIGLVVFIVVCQAAGGIGSIFTFPSVGNWYAKLNKPFWTPPDWVFGPVWTFLFLCMAVAAWLVWRRYGFAGAVVPMALFALQLALNVAWTWVFFGLHLPGAAFAEIIVLWLAILATLIAFWALVPAAGWLMVPYLLWVTYAATLNWGLWKMNP